MDWFDCPICIYRHPFKVTEEKPCPNAALSVEKCRRIFNKDSVLRLDVYGPSGSSTALDTSNVQVSNVQSDVQLDTPLDTSVQSLDTSLDKLEVGSAAYWRERKRIQRERQKLTAISSAI